MAKLFTTKIVRFSLIGVAGAVVDYGTRAGLLALGVPAWLSRALSYLVGSSTTYYANSHLTFSGKRSKDEISRATVVYTFCFILAVLVDALSRNLYQGAYYLEVSWFVSQATATVMNFLLQNFWVFQQTKD